MNDVTQTPTRPLELGLQWRDGFAGLGPAFYTELQPTPLPDPYLVAVNPILARALGLLPELLSSAEAVEALTGNRPIAGTRPLASV